MPKLQDLTPADNGSSLFVSWSSTFGEEVLHFVIQWDNVPARRLQWKMLAKDQRNTSISGINIFYSQRKHSVDCTVYHCKTEIKNSCTLLSIKSKQHRFHSLHEKTNALP